MASMLRQIAQRSSNMIVKSSAANAWETTATLRNQYIYTSLDAMPARAAEASAEWATVRQKIVSRDFSLNEFAAGAARAVELYAFYLFGKVIGSRSVPF